MNLEKINITIPDCVFPSDNAIEIPKLRLDRQAQFIEAPFTVWGEVSRKKAVGGTILFYTHDSRFENLWKQPQNLFVSNCVNAVEPNFSCYDEMPLPVVMYNIYRKRWIARFWQEYGVNILVDLNVTAKYCELNLLGVPQGWRAFATRGYQNRLDDLKIEYELACERAGTREILFVVYGGGKWVKRFQQIIPFVHIEERMDRAKKLIKNKQLFLLEE